MDQQNLRPESNSTDLEDEYDVINSAEVKQISEKETLPEISKSLDSTVTSSILSSISTMQPSNTNSTSSQSSRIVRSISQNSIQTIQVSSPSSPSSPGTVTFAASSQTTTVTTTSPATLRKRRQSRLPKLDQRLDKYPLLQAIEDATSIPKSYLVIGAIPAVFLFVFFGFGMGIICKVVGFLYPLFQSFKAIEKPELHTLKLWLTYWLVYGFFSLFEVFFDTVMSWIPFYYPLKLVFLMWCFLPQYQGAIVVFEKIVRPIMERNLKELEHSLAEAQELGTSLVGRTADKIQSKTVEMGGKVRDAIRERRLSRSGKNINITTSSIAATTTTTTTTTPSSQTTTTTSVSQTSEKSKFTEKDLSEL